MTSSPPVIQPISSPSSKKWIYLLAIAAPVLPFVAYAFLRLGVAWPCPFKALHRFAVRHLRRHPCSGCPLPAGFSRRPSVQPFGRSGSFCFDRIALRSLSTLSKSLLADFLDDSRIKLALLDLFSAALNRLTEGKLSGTG